MCMYVCVCVCVCVCVLIAYMCICSCDCSELLICYCVFVFVWSNVCVCVVSWVCVFVHVCCFTYMCLYVLRNWREDFHYQIWKCRISTKDNTHTFVYIYTNDLHLNINNSYFLWQQFFFKCEPSLHLISSLKKEHIRSQL